MTTAAYPSLAAHFVDVAAGCPVNMAAYQSISGMDMAKVRALGVAYRNGWLDNVLSRITPLTTRAQDDYVAMARLFVPSAQAAQSLLAKMSRDLTIFSVAAGTTRGGSVLAAHTALYASIAKALEQQFGIEAPAPFASVTLDARSQAEILAFRPVVMSVLRKAS